MDNTQNISLISNMYQKKVFLHKKINNLSDFDFQSYIHRWITNQEVVELHYILMSNTFDKPYVEKDSLTFDEKRFIVNMIENNINNRLIVNKDNLTDINSRNIFICPKIFKHWRHDGISWEKKTLKYDRSKKTAMFSNAKGNKIMPDTIVSYNIVLRESQKTMVFNNQNIGRVLYFTRKISKEYLINELKLDPSQVHNMTYTLKRRCYDLKDSPYFLIQFLIEGNNSSKSRSLNMIDFARFRKKESNETNNEKNAHKETNIDTDDERRNSKESEININLISDLYVKIKKENDVNEANKGDERNEVNEVNNNNIDASNNNYINNKQINTYYENTAITNSNNLNNNTLKLEESISNYNKIPHINNNYTNKNNNIYSHLPQSKSAYNTTNDLQTNNNKTHLSSFNSQEIKKEDLLLQKKRKQYKTNNWKLENSKIPDDVIFKNVNISNEISIIKFFPNTFNIPNNPNDSSIKNREMLIILNKSIFDLNNKFFIDNLQVESEEKESIFAKVKNNLTIEVFFNDSFISGGKFINNSILSTNIPLSLPVDEYYIKVKFSINKSVSLLSNNDNIFRNNMFPLYNSFSKNVYFYILESPLKLTLIDNSKVSYNVNNTGFLSANLNSVLFNNSLIPKSAPILMPDSNINKNNFKNNISLNTTNPITLTNDASNNINTDTKRQDSHMNHKSNQFTNNSNYTTNCNNSNKNIETIEINKTTNIQETLPHSKALPLKLSNRSIQSNTCFNAFNNYNIYNNNIGNSSYKNYTNTYLSNNINYQANNYIVNNNNKIYPKMNYNPQNLNNINNLNTNTKNSLLNQAINPNTNNYTSTYNTNTDNISQFKFFLPPELEKTVLDCNDNLSTQTVKKNFLYNKNSILRLEVDILRKRVMNILTDLKTYIDFNQNISNNNNNDTSNANNANNANNTSNNNIITNTINNNTRIFDYNHNKFQQVTSNSSRNTAFLESELSNKLVNSKVYKEISKKQNKSGINNTNNPSNITDTLTKKTQIYEVIFQEDIQLFIELFFSLMNLNNKNPLFFVSKLDNYGCNLLHYFSALDYETPTVFLVKSNIFLMMKETLEEKLTIFEIASSKWNFNTLNALIKLNNSSKIDNFKIDMKYIKSGLNLALDNSIFIYDKNIEVLYLLLKQLRIEFMIDITSEKIIESIKNENLINNNDSNELREANDINNNLSSDDYENNEESSNISKNSKYKHNHNHTNEYVNIKCNDNEQTHKAHNRADNNNNNNNNKKYSSISKLSKKNKNYNITNISSESNTFKSYKSDKSQLSKNSLNTIKSVQSISSIMNSIKTFSDFRKDLSSYINNSLANKSIEEDGSYQSINSISNSNKAALHLNSLNNINSNLNYNLINSMNSINNINSLNEINNLTSLNPLNRKLDNAIKSPSLNNLNALNTLSNMNEMNNINDDINDDINDISQIIHKNQELTGLNDISNDLIQGLLNKPAISINKISNINSLNNDEITNLKNIISKRNDINQENQAKYVSTIQSCVRSFLQRNHYIDLKKNIMKLQTKLKNFMDRRKFVNMKNATITIQKAFRVFLKKK